MWEAHVTVISINFRVLTTIVSLFTITKRVLLSEDFPKQNHRTTMGFIDRGIYIERRREKKNKVEKKNRSMQLNVKVVRSLDSCTRLSSRIAILLAY